MPIGATPQQELTEEAGHRLRSRVHGSVLRPPPLGAAFYVNDRDHTINFVQLANHVDPYTAAKPAAGWPLPPVVFARCSRSKEDLPAGTAFNVPNLGPVREKGVELSLDQRSRTPCRRSLTTRGGEADGDRRRETRFRSQELGLQPTKPLQHRLQLRHRPAARQRDRELLGQAFWPRALQPFPLHGRLHAW